MISGIHQLLNVDAVHEMIKAAYLDGFHDGESHGNLEYKYPPAEIALLKFRQENAHILGEYGILKREELAQINSWEDSIYAQRTRGNDEA